MCPRSLLPTLNVLRLEHGLYLNLSSSPLTSRFVKWNLSHPPFYHHCIRRQDCYMGDIGGAAQAASSVADTTMNDAMNMYEQSQNREFNAEQANAQRAWSAQQAQLGRNFSANEQLQAETFNQQMSDTAVQRRVTDLKAAGINPLLAAGNLGGASSPTMSAPPAPTAGGGASASSNTLPQIQGVMNNLAQLRLTNAQTAKTESETPTPQYVTVEQNPDGTQSIVVNANAGHELGDQALANQKAVIAQINSTISKNASEISLNDATTAGRQLSNQLQADTLNALIKAQNAQATLEATTAQSGQNVMGTTVAGTNLGTWIEALRLILGASKGK